MEDEIADYLSDEYGFLVRGYVLNAESNQDIKWSDVKEMGNSKCPFCFRSAFRLLDEEGEEFSVYEENLAGDNWLLECSRCKAEWNQDGENTLDGGYTGNAEYEAVQAKVTRPVKEEEEPEEESDEGLSTGAKVALGVGALAAGVAIFGAEGEYPQEFLDEFYDFDSNPTADTQDEETIAIAYAAWLESKKNDDYIPYESETDYTEIYGATSGDGYINHDRIDTEEKRMVELRHDDPTTYYNWNSPYDVDESDVDDAVKDELGDEPNEGNYDATVEVLGSKYGENGQKYVDVDVDMDTDYGDSRFMGMAAETFESKGNMMVRLQEVDGEAPHYNCPYCRNELTVLGGKGGIVAVCENESRCNGLELPRQYLEDYEKYHWYVNERKSSDAESKEAESKNLKMALGITAVGIGLAAVLGKDKIKTLFDRFGL